MSTLVLYRWRIRDPATGDWRVTRHRVTEADARAAYPDAEPVEWSREERQVPDDPLYDGATSVWRRRKEDSPGP
ncbi:hypothetical protein [Aquabacterium sp. OR-4]|uniref:hypothetical protein n=1 Tax=Aquabacterium sp. OR-4 TaxID=2978127 RepID=UPI0021B35940|nr:hypothetical protein [Aquabacterium sp. OR-4]MDT7836441.1 hypothetical protein [Aquabacterium sp. OR-4]